jgi:hypothetical protein
MIINKCGHVVFISLFNVSVFSSSRDTWHRVVDMEDQGGIIHYLNYKFLYFVSILLCFLFFSFSINDKIEPNKNGNLVDSSVSTVRTTKKMQRKIKTGLQEEDIFVLKFRMIDIMFFSVFVFRLRDIKTPQ